MNAHRARAILPLLASLLISGCSKTPPNTPLATATSTPKPPPPKPIPGWKQFDGAGAGLWLPESFEGGDIANDLDVVVNRLRSLGPAFEQTANTIKQNPALFVLMLVDSKLGRDGFLTNVNLTKERALSAVTLDMYMDAAVRQMPAVVKLTDRKKVHLDVYEAGRLETRMEVSNKKVKGVVYIIRDKNVFWTITYSTSMAESEERLPTFEKSANTFRTEL